MSFFNWCCCEKCWVCDCEEIEVTISGVVPIGGGCGDCDAFNNTFILPQLSKSGGPPPAPYSCWYQLAAGLPCGIDYIQLEIYTGSPPYLRLSLQDGFFNELMSYTEEVDPVYPLKCKETKNLSRTGGLSWQCDWSAAQFAVKPLCS